MYQLRPYQQIAVDSTLRYFQKQREPAVLVLPTGAGKSLVIAELARIARGRVLVLAHVKELVEQNHGKYESYGLEAGIYAAGLDRKDKGSKVIFGSIQSVARAGDDLFKSFSLLVIDECHRVSMEEDTQYALVIKRLRAVNPTICILGLTATPYRLGMGWIYQFSHRGLMRTSEPRFFKKCIYDLTLGYMIKSKYLTPPIKIDSPVAGYDFSSLKLRGDSFALKEVEHILKDQGRITPGIIANIVEMARDRQAVMIFTASVRHAEEIMTHLPPDESALVLGETAGNERDAIIKRFKDRQIKYLVNVSVLTTGFDAPHVDLIAILRPTESVALYQQIVGRGLRLAEGKTDCLILDYTGIGHDIFSPEIDEDKPSADSVPVVVTCPDCGHQNDFWGLVDPDGELVEHFGRKCRGAKEDPATLKVIPCNFRFRFKRCAQCGSENDIAARICNSCQATLVDNDKKLKEAMSLKDAHVMRPDSMHFEKTYDKKGQARIEVKYYDYDGESLREFFYMNAPSDYRAFYYNFMRMHLRIPEAKVAIESADDVLRQKDLFRMPMFVIARKKTYYWEVREKIFE
ncbi:MAG: DEAD/DEAH box helicase family protein [Oligoflexus sp.]|nr:DEAD/DEAH box helicase family protein [Oligoflexus sp.]